MKIISALCRAFFPVAIWAVGRSGRGVVANMNLQFMEANTRDERSPTFVNVTRGKVVAITGCVAIGNYALYYHQGDPLKLRAARPRPLDHPWLPMIDGKELVPSFSPEIFACTAGKSSATEPGLAD